MDMNTGDEEVIAPGQSAVQDLDVRPTVLAEEDERTLLNGNKVMGKTWVNGA